MLTVYKAVTIGCETKTLLDASVKINNKICNNMPDKGGVFCIITLDFFSVLLPKI